MGITNAKTGVGSSEPTPLAIGKEKMKKQILIMIIGLICLTPIGCSCTGSAKPASAPASQTATSSPTLIEEQAADPTTVTDITPETKKQEPSTDPTTAVPAESSAEPTTAPSEIDGGGIQLPPSP